METKELMALIETLKASDYGHIEVQHEGSHLVFDKNSLPPLMSPMAVHQVPANPSMASAVTGISTSAPSPTSQAAPAALSAANVELEVKAVTPSNLKTIDSPIVGTFYEAAGPEAAPFVKVGDQIKKGDVVCIIEAMKLMNEIEAEFDGEIVEILAKNEGPVEYGQALFSVKPN